MRFEELPPWAPEFDSYQEPDFIKARRTAEALGWLVMGWGSLERDIGTLLLKLIGTKFVYEITGNMDFREKLAVIKSVGFEIMPSPEWFDELEQTTKEIDQKLRPERNRMIHDLWIFHFEKEKPMVRFGLTPKLRRPQSRRRVQTRDITDIARRNLGSRAQDLPMHFRRPEVDGSI
ncbi:MAG: hypothetical protein WA709_07980 [Stellaceae bacterium]